MISNNSSVETKDLVLFPIPVFIWGLTWYAITFQVGTVAPILSVSYRFLLAGVLFIAFCLLKGVSLNFSPKQHLAIYLQSVLLFGLNYLFAYSAEQYIESGLVAIMFSLIIFLNVIFGRILLGSPVRKQVLKGALLGLTGTAMIFYPEISGINADQQTLYGLGLAAIAIVFASLGNIGSAYNQKNKLPVIPSTAVGMFYGGLSMFVIAIIMGNIPTFDTSTSYVVSLLYLSIFGSIIAFSAFLTLIGRIGADKAAYAMVVVPVIAIAVSVVFEDYNLTPMAGVGIVFLVIGNFIALKRPDAL